jgi:hypothetical protein
MIELGTESTVKLSVAVGSMLRGLEGCEGGTSVAAAVAIAEVALRVTDSDPPDCTPTSMLDWPEGGSERAMDEIGLELATTTSPEALALRVIDCDPVSEMVGTLPLGPVNVSLPTTSADVGMDPAPLLVIGTPDTRLESVSVGGEIGDEDPGITPVGRDPSDGRTPLGADGGVTVGTDGRMLLAGGIDIGLDGILTPS